MCIEVTLPAAPTLGLGLSIAPPSTPGFSGNLDLCCKSVPYAIPSYTPPLPAGVFNPAVAIALGAAMDAIQAFLNDSLPSCPLE